MKKRILLTGVGGFIGTHCLKYFLNNTDWDIVGLDSFRHKGTYSRLNELDLSSERLTILKHDLTVPIDEYLENRIMGRAFDANGTTEKGIDYIVNMASDSAVERSVSDPGQCWRNNCELIYNMLELARRIKPKIFYQVSTDEIYGDCPKDYFHPEWDTVTPSNPYAASKAAQEALAISYWRSYNVPVVITNCINCIGTMQDKEKFLPKLISKIAKGEEMQIYADFKPDGSYEIGSRSYLHCDNHADIFVWLSDKPISSYANGDKLPDKYNVCSDVQLNNLEMAELIPKIMGKPLKYKLVPSQSARPGYDKRYALSGKKLKDMGWNPPIDFVKGIEQIVNWSLEHPWWVI